MGVKIARMDELETMLEGQEPIPDTICVESEEEEEISGPSPEELKAKLVDQNDPLVLSGNVHPVISYDDPEVEVYKDMKTSQLPLQRGCFLAEGPETVKLLLFAVEYEIVSLLLKPTTYGRMKDDIDQLVKSVRPQLRVLIADKFMMTKLVGYNFPRGALACGVRRSDLDMAWLRDHVLRDDKPQWRILAIDATNDAENLGSQIRSASAFGVDCVLLSNDSCDAFYRRTIRVSMGHIFRVPVVRCNLVETLQMLQEECGVTAYSAVIDEGTPHLHDISVAPKRWLVVVGNEGSGICPEVRAATHNSVRVFMEPGVDSLNIGVAAAILMNGFRERERAQQAPQQ